MLQRSTLTNSWLQWRHGALAGPTTALLRYVLILGLICAVACLYFLQANRLSRLDKATVSMAERAAALELENIELTRQWAQWNTPSYIQTRAKEAGFVTDGLVIRTQRPVDGTHHSIEHAQDRSTTAYVASTP